MLKLYDKESREITNEPAKCVCDNPACLGEPRRSVWGICITVLGSGESTSTTEFSDFGLEDKYNLFCELSQQEDFSPTYTAEFLHFSSTIGATYKPTRQNHLSSSLQSNPCHQPAHLLISWCFVHLFKKYDYFVHQMPLLMLSTKCN